jgi:alcohol dehydrogenase
VSAWAHYSPVEIRFGAGRLAELPELARGRPALLVTTAGFTRRGVTGQIRDLLAGAELRVLDTVAPNPDLGSIELALAALGGAPIELVIGLGGGSAIDTAKALSYALPAGGPGLLTRHFREGEPLPGHRPLPLIAIPTTAGTGSEVTPFATIWDQPRAKKHSLARPDLHPAAALLDPCLTLGLPADVTIATGLDALSQGCEAIWNRNATPIATGYGQRAVALALATLPRLAAELDNLELRSAMLEASLMAGLAISQTRTALAHSISYPITARHGVPHGLACSFTLPALLAFNAEQDDGRLAGAAAAIGLGSVAAWRERLLGLLAELDMGRRLRQYIGAPEQLIDLAPEMLTPGRSDNNMRAAGVGDVREIIRAALDDCRF